MAELQMERLLLHFAHSCRAEGKSPNTVAWYFERGSHFVRFLVETGRKPTLANFNLETAREFIVHEQERGLSPFTILADAKTLRAISTWLFNETYTKENRLSKLKLPKVPLKLIEPLTPAEIEDLLKVRRSANSSRQP